MNAEMEAEIQAVKVRRLGQCPKEKGHPECFFEGFFAGASIAVLLIAMVNIVLVPDLRKEAIEKGHAYRDAKTGEFTWH